jgi:hypothetical protein
VRENDDDDDDTYPEQPEDDGRKVETGWHFHIKIIFPNLTNTFTFCLGSFFLCERSLSVDDCRPNW